MPSTPDLVTIYSPRDESEHMLVQSMLRGAGIEFVSKNAITQNLFGVGQIGGFNPAHGSIEVQVLAHDVDAARQVLSDLLDHDHSGVAFDIPETCPACGRPTYRSSTCPDCGLAFTSESPDPPPAPESPADVEAESGKMATMSIVWAVLWLGGVGSLLAIRFGLRSINRAREITPPLAPPRKALFGIILGSLGLAFWVVYWLGVSRM